MPGILLNSFTAVASRHRKCGAGSTGTSSQYYSASSMDSSSNSRRNHRNYHHDSSISSSSSSSASSRRTTPSSTASNSAMNTPDRSSSPTPQDRWYSNTVATATPSHSQRPTTTKSVSSVYHSRHASLWGTEIPNSEPHMSWGQFIDFDTSS